MADDKANRSARKAAVGHQADDNAAFTAQGGDPRGRIQHFRHTRAANRPFIANNDHVAVLEFLRRAVEHLEKLLLAVEDPCGSGEYIVLQTALDTGKLQNGAEFGREVAAEDTKTACRLVGCRHRVNHVAVRRRRIKPRDLLGKGLAGTCQDIAIEKARIEKVFHEHLNAALGIDIDHRIATERPRVDDHRNDVLRQVVEFLGAHHVAGEIRIAGGAGDFGRMKHHIRRTADRHGDDDGVADRLACDDVARLDVLCDHVFEAVDQLVREFGHPALVLRGRRYHVKRLHADNADKGLHRVIGEHAAAAAEPGTAFKRDAALQVIIVAPRKLIAGDDVDRLSCGRILSRTDRPVGHDDGRTVMLEDRGKRSDRRLVAGDDRDNAFQAGRAEMFAQGIIRDLAADQRIAHLLGAVADAVRGGDGEFRLYQPHRHLAVFLADARAERVMDCRHLGADTDVALRIALRADNADRRLMDEVDRGAEFARDAKCLAVAARVLVDKHGL